MNEAEHVSGPLRDLIDDYLNGLMDEARLKELEALLRADGEARRYFVRYARLHTDLHLEMRAQRAGARALDSIDRLEQDAAAPTHRTPATSTGAHSGAVHPWFASRVLVPAASLLLAAGIGWWLIHSASGPNGPGHERAVAWLINAQNCRWSDEEPAGDMQAGKTLTLQRGLAEIRFACGAKVVLEGPATLELLSGKSARLQQGKLTAHVPEAATGFEILSPQGKVIDLGTEFGISVSEDGAANVYVFAGKVEARSTDAGPSAANAVSLSRNQAARIAAGKVIIQPADHDAGADHFVRAIVPPPVIVPRTWKLAFDRIGDGIRDRSGASTGLTHRLPDTGTALPQHDPNLRLDPVKRQLELTTTKSDINTQHLLHQGEYLGVRLSDLGFTGKEDFAVTASFPNIPALESVGQFGVYAGARSDKNIRGGLISRMSPGERYTQFLVNNDGGSDADTNRVGLLSTGDDLRITLRRTGGKYALTVENRTTRGSSTLSIRHPEFLDSAADLYVGLFGANTQSDVRKTLVIKELSVTVWTLAPGVEPAIAPVLTSPNPDRD